MTKRRRAARGFSLLEALVALTVVAICLAAIGELAHTTMRADARAESGLSALALSRALTESPATRALGPANGGENAARAWRAAPERALAPAASGWTPVLYALEIADPRGAKMRVEFVRLSRMPRE